MSSCLSKVDTFCGKKVCLPKYGGEKVRTGPPLPHRRWVSGEADGLVELVDCDFWFHCQESAGVHSDVYKVYNTGVANPSLEKSKLLYL